MLLDQSVEFYSKDESWILKNHVLKAEAGVFVAERSGVLDEFYDDLIRKYKT